MLVPEQLSLLVAGTVGLGVREVTHVVTVVTLLLPQTGAPRGVRVLGVVSGTWFADIRKRMEVVLILTSAGLLSAFRVPRLR